jgi:hypothetical protein
MTGHLESAPDHATLRTSHAANEHAGVVLGLLRDKHARLGGAGRERAVHRAGQAGSARVAKFLDGTPCCEARVAGLALDAVWVVTGVLVKWNGVGKVSGTDNIPTATAVVFAEIPCEVGLADGAGFGRLIGLEEESVSRGLVTCMCVCKGEVCMCMAVRSRSPTLRPCETMMKNDCVTGRVL